MTHQQATNIPSPVWLAEHQKARQLHKQAVAEDWTIGRLVDESLRVGLVPLVSFADRPAEPFAQLRNEMKDDHWKDWERYTDED